MVKAFIVFYILANILAIIIGVFFENSRYKSNSHETKSDGWIKTDEQFIDNATGKLITVQYNPKTGERKYVE